jgi:putative hydrolase of the HAD superfamily
MIALVLDLGGVVYRSWPDEAFHACWAARCGCEPGALAERLWRGPEWGPAELGAMTEADCYAVVAARLGVETALVRQIVTEAFASAPDEALAAYVAQLRRAGVIVAALTNNTARESALAARPELARLFDVVISSANAGLQKPDPAIYRHAEARIGARASEIVFLDDVATHVDAAKALGWRAFLFRSTDQALADVAAALRDLQQAG